MAAIYIAPSASESQSPLRGTVHSDKLQCPDPGSRRTCAVSIPSSGNRPFGRKQTKLLLRERNYVSIPSSGNRPFGRHGGALTSINSLRVSIPSSGNRPFGRIRKDKSASGRNCVSIPSSGNRPFGLLPDDILVVDKVVLYEVSIPSSGNRPFGHHINRITPHRSHRSLNPLVGEPSIRTQAAGARLVEYHVVSIPSSGNRPFGHYSSCVRGSPTGFRVSIPSSGNRPFGRIRTLVSSV